jgi:hypothetical protein
MPKGNIKLGNTLYIWAEPTVLLLILASFQRIKIRCYNIDRGYASILIYYLTHTIRYSQYCGYLVNET